MVAIIDMCLEKSFDIVVPDSLTKDMSQEGFLLQVERWMPKELEDEVIHTKEAILQEMLPNVKLDLYLYSLDFVIKQNRGEADE